MNFLATRRAGFLACFFLLALANCGGGGGDGEDSGGLVAVFTPNCTSGDPCYSGSVTLQPGGGSGSTFEVDVVLNKLNTVIGAAGLRVSFDPTKVEYQNFVKGTALGTGAGTNYIVTPKSGEIEVSIAVPAGKSISSADVLVILLFKAREAGTSSLSFLDTNIVDGSALYRIDGSVIVPVAWSGGLATAS